jgi:hypothetical protein
MLSSISIVLDSCHQLSVRCNINKDDFVVARSELRASLLFKSGGLTYLENHEGDVGDSSVPTPMFFVFERANRSL